METKSLTTQKSTAAAAGCVNPYQETAESLLLAPAITRVSALERLAPYDAFFGSQGNHEFSLQVCTMLELGWSILLYHIHHHVGA